MEKHYPQTVLVWIFTGGCISGTHCWGDDQSYAQDLQLLLDAYGLPIAVEPSVHQLDM